MRGKNFPPQILSGEGILWSICCSEVPKEEEGGEVEYPPPYSHPISFLLLLLLLRTPLFSARVSNPAMSGECPLSEKWWHIEYDNYGAIENGPAGRREVSALILLRGGNKGIVSNSWKLYTDDIYFSHGVNYNNLRRVFDSDSDYLFGRRLGMWELSFNSRLPIVRPTFCWPDK